ncbi:hypothetical protein, partial [Marinimicrobium sp. UBA4209]
MSEPHSRDSQTETHEVFNVPPPLEGYDAYREDVALQELIKTGGAGWAEAALHEQGRALGDPGWIQCGFDA